VGLGDHAVSHGVLLEPLYRLVPEARVHATPDIRAHYTAGALVPASRVPALLEKLRAARTDVLTRARDDSLDRRPEHLWQKLVEALTYAARKGVGLLEAGEVRVADEGGMP